MDFADIVQAVFEFANHGWEFLVTNFDPVKAFTIGLAAITSLISIVIKVRNSGFRLVTRLEEFLAHQDQRLAQSRLTLSRLVETPVPGGTHTAFAFDEKKLHRAIRYMHWGFGKAAENDLSKAIQISANQARLSLKQSQEHKNRQALAHLLLGARAASKPLANPLQRASARHEALTHFDAALQINPRDADALEYSAMMLLELADPAGALARINELIELRQMAGGFALAKAYRLQASAFEALPQPQLLNANNALVSALDCIPAEMAMERAYTAEQLGRVRFSRGTYPSARRSLLESRKIYASLKSMPGAQAGFMRVEELLGRIQSSPAPGISSDNDAG